MKVKNDKYTKIIESAIEEFADKGYKLASTNIIAKRANVSKGLIFKYFKTKENLYIESLANVAEQLQSEFKSFWCLSSESDFFGILKKWGLKKIQLFYEKPTLLKFLLSSLDTPKELFEKIKDIYNKTLESSISILYESFSQLPLRQDIPKEKMFEALLTIFQSLEDNYVRKFYKNSSELIEKKEELLKDWEIYLEIIKNGTLSNIQSSEKSS